MPEASENKGAKGPQRGTRRRTLESVTLSQVEEERMDWLWKNRIPKSMLSLVAGLGDVGKSTFLYDVASRISLGAEWPNGEGNAPKGSVILFNQEDPLAQIIKPRIMAAGGDADKIRVVLGAKNESGQPEQFTYEHDLDALEDTIAEMGDVRLVVFDPLSSYFGQGVNAWKEDQVRRVLEPLTKRAEKWGVAVVGNTHLGKDTKAGQANLRVLNSVGIVNLARSVYMVAKDKADPELRVIGPTKKNVLPPMPSLQFRFEGVRVPPKKIKASRVVWQGTTEMDVEELVTDTGDGRGVGPRETAKAVLRAVLSKGPVLTGEVYSRAEAAGLSERTTRRAIEELGVVPRKAPGVMDGPWMLEMPGG